MTGLPSPNEGFSLTKLTPHLPIIAAVVAIAIGWQELKSTSAELKTQMALTVGIYDKLEDRTRDLEQESARADERFTLILTLMTEMKAQIAELTRDQKNGP